MNIDPLTFLIASLCTYRMSLMVVREKGPGHVFKKVRETPSKASKVYDWLTCLFCFSMTSSALVCGVLYWTGLRQHLGHWLLLWCAMSAVAISIHMVFKHREP